jgi:hypothetical protein
MYWAAMRARGNHYSIPTLTQGYHTIHTDRISIYPMELGWEARPLSIAHNWRSHTPSNPPPSAFSTTSNSPQRRRSAATNVPPPAPPPNQPIPRIPADTLLSPISDTVQYFPQVDRAYSHQHSSAYITSLQPRVQSISTTQPSASSSSDTLSDAPPRPMLQISSSRVTSHHHPPVPDRLLLPPSDHPRPSSRRTLTRALELAKEAVKLDSTNNDPFGAVIAYGRSVALLSEVMERVRRGEDSAESPHRRRNGRRRSVVAQEEEVRRLKSIVNYIFISCFILISPDFSYTIA